MASVSAASTRLSRRPKLSPRPPGLEPHGGQRLSQGRDRFVEFGRELDDSLNTLSSNRLARLLLRGGRGEII